MIIHVGNVVVVVVVVVVVDDDDDVKYLFYVLSSTIAYNATKLLY